MRVSRRAVAALSAAACVLTVACVIVSVGRTVAKPLPPGLYDLVSPLRVHLRDGSVVLFRRGARVGAGSIDGVGVRFGPMRRDSTFVSTVPLDSVLGAEVVTREQDAAASLARSVLASAGATLAVALVKLTFGSCPTVYSDSAGTPVLEAESFSYSIAPMLAKRDVDRLRAAPDERGVVRLEVRNEALETHFIDHVELLEVRRAAGEEVFAEPRGEPVALADPRPAVSVRDRSGRDLRRLLAAADGATFGTSEGRLAAAAAPDAPADSTQDWIEVAVPRRAGAGAHDSVAIALRMRSSLLTTLLFYDHMLARPGAASLDWVGRDLGRITTLARLGRWYAGTAGLRVSVLDGGRWRQVARLADFGPIAWRNVAVMVPAVGDDSVRVRLTFLADQWRIDRLAVSARARRVRPRAVPLARVSASDGAPVAAAYDALRRPDDRPLQTLPGQRFFAEFDVGRADGPRTFFIAAQGYYNEWVRGAWLAAPTDSVPFDPGRLKVPALLREWRQARDSMEAQFFRAKVPVS
ncbi:MAG: hypothetical protein ACJ8AO_08890 [Gemmatimonadaceae bacterium]